MCPYAHMPICHMPYSYMPICPCAICPYGHMATWSYAHFWPYGHMPIYGHMVTWSYAYKPQIRGRRQRRYPIDPPPPSVRRAKSESECSLIFKAPTLSLPRHAASATNPSPQNSKTLSSLPTSLFFSIWDQLFANKNLIEQHILPKTTQTFKKLNHGRPMARF